MISLMLFSCGKNSDNRDLNEYVSAFLNENPTIAVFGKADLNTILNKADYKNIAKFGGIAEAVLEEFKISINTETPVFYALEGPFSQKGVPATFYAFIDVKNADSLIINLTQKGYDFEKDGDMNFSQFGDISLGIKNDLAIIVSKAEEYKGKEYLAKAFEKSNGDISEGKVNEMLQEKGDVVLGFNLESIYSTSNTELSKLSESKQKEVKEMVDNSFSQTVFKFENGAAIIETKNYFSDALKKRMFLKSNADASIVRKLGSGNPRFGFSLNFDMDKLQSLINDYSPEALNDLGKKLGGPTQMALMMGGEKALSGLFSGELGLVLVGDPGSNGSMIPDFNAYLGLGDKGKSISEMAKAFLSNGTMMTKINSNEICCYSSPNYAPVAGKSLSIPLGCENFGKKSVTGFINFDGLDMSSMDLEGGAKIFNIIKYINFEFDENGGRIVIKAKNGQENILKQSLNFFLKEFENQINGMVI